MEKTSGDIWIEKYRPKSLSEMVGQDAIVSLLKAYVSRRALPHLLFAGPPGTGKTTAAIALARDLFGEDWRESFLELNASVTGDTPVLVRFAGRTERTTMGDLARRYLHDGGPDRAVTEGVEILSVDRSAHVRFMPVSRIIRHRVPRVARITVDGGSVRTSFNHSVIVIDRMGRFSDVPVSSLRPGDALLSFTPLTGGREHVLDLARHAPPTEVRVSPGRPLLASPSGPAMRGPVDLDEDLMCTFGNYATEGSAPPVWMSGMADLDHGNPREAPSAGSGLLPSRPFVDFISHLPTAAAGNWKHDREPALDGQGAHGTLKNGIERMVDSIDPAKLTTSDREALERWKTLARSDLYALEILGIEEEEWTDYVYDVSVPGSEMFWGGTVPLLLHNSDERGIDTVRGTIKNYARTVTLSSVPFKILFLDEGDQLTNEAQSSLRRMMERYATICRFVISCNYSSRIIPPIQSRCAVFRFRPLKVEDVKGYLSRIAKSEGKTVEASALEAIIQVAMGDLRQSVNILQQASAISDTVDADAIYESSALPMPKEVEGLITSALEGHFREARERLQNLLTEKGASGEDILRAIHSQVQTLPIPDLEKMRLIDHLAELEFRISEGATPRIQIEALLARLVATRLK